MQVLWGLRPKNGTQRVCQQKYGERSLVALKTKAAQDIGVAAIPEESPVGDSQANGEIESAVKEVKGQIRAVKSQLEENLGFAIDVKHPIFSWLPTYAVDMISRHRIEPDGRTAEKRRTGKNGRRPAFQFGESIFVKVTMSKTETKCRGSYEMVMNEGRYIGHHGRTGALLTMTLEGILRGAGARRRPVEERWQKTGQDELKGYPWDVQPRERTAGLPLILGADAESLPLPKRALSLLPLQERRMYVARSDVQKFGETPGCEACLMIALAGKTTVPHNDECRMRIAELLARSEEGQGRLETHRRKRRVGEAKEPRLAGGSAQPELAGGSASSSGIAGGAVGRVAG